MSSPVGRLVAAILLFAVVTSVAAKRPVRDPSIRQIQTRVAGLASEPRALAPIIKSLKFGDEVWSMESRRSWTRVQVMADTAARGWIQGSSLTITQLVMKDSDVTDDMKKSSPGSLRAANKGMGEPGVKSSFLMIRKDISETDFTIVDSMEARRITVEEILKFIEVGELHPVEGDSL